MVDLYRVLTNGGLLLVVAVIAAAYAAFKWSGNLHNLSGIRKDHVEIQKAGLDMKKTSLDLEALSSRIHRPTDAEVARYGPDPYVLASDREARVKHSVRDKSGWVVSTVRGLRVAVEIYPLWSGALFIVAVLLFGIWWLFR